MLSVHEFLIFQHFALTEDAKQILEIPGLSTGVGIMIYAGSIGTQIANELGDTYR